MTDHGRPRSAASGTVIVARPALGWPVVVGAILAAAVVIIPGLLLLGMFSGGVVQLIGLALVLAGVLLLALPFLARSERVGKWLTGWYNPTLEITPWPLHLGSPATVMYRRRPVKANTLNTLAGAPAVLAELVCQEWVRYTVGTTTRTDTDEVVRLRAATPGRIVPDGLEAAFELTIPIDFGGPTLDLDNNRVGWWLETRLDDPFGRRTAAKVDLVVPGVVDRDAVMGEGGFERGERV